MLSYHSRNRTQDQPISGQTLQPTVPKSPRQCHSITMEVGTTPTVPFLLLLPKTQAGHQPTLQCLPGFPTQQGDASCSSQHLCKSLFPGKKAALWLSWLKRLSSKQEILGSNPSRAFCSYYSSSASVATRRVACG